MNVFDLRNFVTSEYRRFSTGYSTIKAQDIKQFVNGEHEQQCYWPAPLVQINPRFMPGESVEGLVASGVLHDECAGIFRAGKKEGDTGVTLQLHKHQEEAIAIG